MHITKLIKGPLSFNGHITGMSIVLVMIIVIFTDWGKQGCYNQGAMLAHVPILKENILVLI
jgi:hypothetical protein